MMLSRNILPRIYRKLNDIALCGLNEDYARIRHIPQHLDLINLGSNPAKYGLDYADTGVKAFNLAVGPQTLEYDFRMLKNYHSFLDEKGAKLLLLLLCPFSLLKFRYTEYDGYACRDHRYYPILHHSMINNYEEQTYTDLKKRTLLHLLKHPLRLLSILKGTAQKKMKSETNPLNEQQMTSSAEGYIRGWMREFGLHNFELKDIPQSVKNDLQKNSEILDEIKAFCDERGIKPVIVLPPVSEYIMGNIPQGFREYCTYSILKQKDILMFDYMNDHTYNQPANFVDALCLNKTGRRKFTQGVLSDLKRLKLLK